VTLTYGLQFDLKEDCLSNVQSNDGCEQLITFEELVSNEISRGYCDRYESEPMWDQSSYWSAINAPVSARWLLSFSISFILSIFIFTVFSLTFALQIQYAICSFQSICCERKRVDVTSIPEIIDTEQTSRWSCIWRSNRATNREPDKMVSMKIIDQDVHDESCTYELVLNSECIPAEVSMQHLIENPKGLLEFVRKKSSLKNFEAQESCKEGQAPVAPDMSFTSSSSVADHSENFGISLDKPGKPKRNNIENEKRQDNPRADNELKQISLSN
jgi:hypothetical protein